MSASKVHVLFSLQNLSVCCSNSGLSESDTSNTRSFATVYVSLMCSSYWSLSV